MAKIFEFKKPEQNKDKSCSWCQHRNNHPLDPPCDKCKWYDRDTVFELELEDGSFAKFRKEVDPDTYRINFIPADEDDIDL